MSLIIFLFLSIAQDSIGQGIVDKISESNFTIGKTIEIKSAILGENRELNIYLPLSYSADSLASYPVIYLLDGSEDEDFIHISGLVQFASFSWIRTIPESIVVGIANVDRMRDFTYPSDNETERRDFPNSGNSKIFIEFIQKELQAFIDSNFRTTKSRTLIGQSLGGLLATEILLNSPDIFDNYIIVSPSLWWSDQKLLHTSPVKYSSSKSIYIAVGKEGAAMENTTRALYDRLINEKRGNTKLFFDYLEDKNHGDALHQAVYNAFEKMFKNENN